MTAESTQLVTDFVALNRDCVLSTISSAHDGYPFASVAPYDVDEQFRLTIFISRISEHYRNLLKDSRASVFVSDGDHFGDPQAFARATVLGRFVPVDEAELTAVSESYFARFPTAPGRALAHDFQFFRLTPERIRWIGGFGDIRWVDAKRLSDAKLDTIAYHGAEITAHMNQDHPDALKRYALAFANLNPDEHTIRMVAVDANKFVLSLFNGKTPRRVTIPFSRTLMTMKEVREETISLLAKCE